MIDPGEFVDLFSGAGGFTRGLLNAGWRLRLGIDFDPTCGATFSANYGHGSVLVKELHDIDSADLPAADLVVGGLPSQGYAGLQGSKGTYTTDLWQQFQRAVGAIQPSAFVLETVPAFLRSPSWKALANGLPESPLEGYSVVAMSLDAADYGVPQRRRRLYVLGSRGHEMTGPPPSHSEEATLDGLAPWGTLRTALEGIPWETSPARLPSRWMPFGDGRVRGPYRSDELHLMRAVREKSVKRANSVPPGGNREDVPRDLLPDCWAQDPGGWRDAMGRLLWDRPSVTIRTEFLKPEKGRYLHPQWDPLEPTRRVNRSITHWEAARLQTFPDDYLWCGTKLDIARQIGNATPVALAEAIGRHVTSVLSKRNHERGQGRLLA